MLEHIEWCLTTQWALPSAQVSKTRRDNERRLSRSLQTIEELKSSMSSTSSFILSRFLASEAFTLDLSSFSLFIFILLYSLCGKKRNMCFDNFTSCRLSWSSAPPAPPACPPSLPPFLLFLRTPFAHFPVAYLPGEVNLALLLAPPSCGMKIMSFRMWS